jgi:glutathione peroxidase
MFEKTHVKGDQAHPMFQALKAESGTYPKWNFHKYLIGRDGNLISSFGPRTRPYDEDLIKAMNTALNN